MVLIVALDFLYFKNIIGAYIFLQIFEKNGKKQCNKDNPQSPK